MDAATPAQDVGVPRVQSNNGWDRAPEPVSNGRTTFHGLDELRRQLDEAARNNGDGHPASPAQFTTYWDRGPRPLLVARYKHVGCRVNRLLQRIVMQVEGRTSTGRRHGYPRSAIPNTVRKLNYAFRELRRIEDQYLS
jgi:hypothetical protein